jgi:hypothetical protein
LNTPRSTPTLFTMSMASAAIATPVMMVRADGIFRDSGQEVQGGARTRHLPMY